MWLLTSAIVLVFCSFGNTREIPKFKNNALANNLSLPSNATVIRTDITDNFSCQKKTYGYYADVENDCQIFHVCLPITYPNGKERTFKWSFICPEETLFNQEAYTCVRMEEMSIACSDSEKYYEFDNELRVMNEVKNNEMAAETKRNKMKYMSVRKYVKQSATPVAPFEGNNNDTVVTSSNVLTSEQLFPLVVPNTLIQSDDIKELLQEQQPVPIFQRNKQFAAKFRSDFKMPASFNQAVAAQTSGPQEGPKRFVFQADV